jgi:hypothetical protein
LKDNSIYLVDNEKFLFFLNDLTAAKWVIDIEACIPDQELASRFMTIHQIFLGRLGRQEKGILRKVPATTLVKVVRGWIILYQCTIALLRRQHPRLQTSRDLVIGKYNWSEELKISASGLLLLDHSSRYAEFWAERSINTKDAYFSLESRLSFVGSHVYNAYAQMVRKGELLVLDVFSNGVTSYDMMLFLKDSNCSPESFLSEMKKLGWRLELGNEKSIDIIFQLYNKYQLK